ncbi:hypothetical protein B0H17DRAFT_1242967 [Mycena rosella]|uniref:Cytochrome P450 n=1 Tax=Mycena rosella TaxID=1033263 RepID=A0AAD7D0L3_MYCRO|nr:hypothetical protein B0H17DRAFT_1242967 [Mycena rosella]
MNYVHAITRQRRGGSASIDFIVRGGVSTPMNYIPVITRQRRGGSAPIDFIVRGGVSAPMNYIPAITRQRRGGSAPIDFIVRGGIDSRPSSIIRTWFFPGDHFTTLPRLVNVIPAMILVPIVGTLLCYVVLYAVQFAYRDLTSPLGHVVGPKRPSLIVGNFRKMGEKWYHEFGPAFGSAVYSHKRHRRVLNPIVGVPQIRMMTEVFVEKAVQHLGWSSRAGEQHRPYRGSVLAETHVIGDWTQAGFDYQLDALDAKGKPNKLDQVFTQLFHSSQANRNLGFRVAQSRVPFLDSWYPSWPVVFSRLLQNKPLPGMTLLASARAKMLSIGGRIVSTFKPNLEAPEGDKALGNRRDLLSVLLTAKLSRDIPESQRLTDIARKNVLCSSAVVISHPRSTEIPTFFIAGHGTTRKFGPELTLCAVQQPLGLCMLSPSTRRRSPKIREELLTMSTANPTMDELNCLPYLETVVRETMRLHAPVKFYQ